MNQYYYKIGDLLSFVIVDNTGYISRLLSATEIQFSNFQVDEKIKNPDLSIEIGSFKNNKSSYKILDDNYHIDKDYFYTSDSRKFTKWQIEIENLSTCPAARIDANIPGMITRPLNLTEFLIQYCLLMRGYSFIHSAAVIDNNRVMLLAGTGGTGKTTICLSLMGHGYDYMSDNFTIIKNKEAYGYLTPFNIFYYNRVPIIEKSLTSGDKRHLFFRKLIYDLSAGYIKIFHKINPKKILADRIVESGEITHLCFLESNDKYNEKIMPPCRLSIENVVKKLRLNMEIEWYFFNKYFASYGYLFPESSFGNFWEECEALLFENLIPVKNLFSLGVPTYYRPDLKEEVVRVLMELHGK